MTNDNIDIDDDSDDININIDNDSGDTGLPTPRTFPTPTYGTPATAR